MNNAFGFEGVQVFSNGKLGAPQTFWVKEGAWVEGPISGATLIPAQGAWVLPGLFALGVDFQEPIRDDVYILRDGFEAMLRGGFSSALYESPANPIDDVHKLRSLQDACGKSGLDFHYLGAISAGNDGKALAEMLELASGGVAGFGDGNHFPSNLRFLRLALEYAGMTGLRCFFQPTERSLAGKGCVHEGHYADTLGMRGIPAQAETIAVHQILELAGWLHVPVHLKQLTCSESLNLVRHARAKNVDVTCDVSIYHLLLDDSQLIHMDTNLHLRPVLRTAEDREALWVGLTDGTVQAISCAHSPVLPQDKLVNFEEATPGAVSLEILLGALHTEASKRNISVDSWLPWITEGAAQSAGLPFSSLGLGLDSPFLLFHPGQKRVIGESDFAGQVHNSPLLGSTLQGSVLGTFFGQTWRPAR